MKNAVQKFGKFLSAMVMPNIGAFIAWGLITALFIEKGWFPNAKLATMVDPMLKYILPVLIGYQGGKLVAGERGGVIAVIAILGVICGSNEVMFMGAMAMGPFAGWVIKKFDKAVDGHIPAGFEMLVNNFSVGIIGMILAIIGYYLIGPVMTAILTVLTAGVDFLIGHSLLPLVSVFVEPAKVLFLNNAINHGIFTPIGGEQVQAAGKSIMYMIEANPGAGLGVLSAYWAFSKDKRTKDSAPGAIIIHFFGGIHEIYFPYVLMNPVVILASIAGSACAVFYYSLFNVGLTGPASPGSIIAFLTMAPKGSTLMVLLGVVIAAVVSFLVAAPIIKMSNGKSLEEASDSVQSMKAASKGIAKKAGEIKKIVFACDAGMGSSAMGATKFRNRIKPLGLGITVINSSVDTVPADTDVVVCQEVLADRAAKSAPNAQLVTIRNFLQDEAIDGLYDKLAESQGEGAAPDKEAAPEAEQVISETKAKPTVMVKEGIRLGQKSVSKEEAIEAAGNLLYELGYVEKDYIEAMQERERTVSTYLGMGVAIPHGTGDAKNKVKKTGIVLVQYPDGVDFGDEKAQLVFGIAGVGNEHLELLGKITQVIDSQENLDKLKTAGNVQDVLDMLK
ncbi:MULTISPECIES: PTS mannitol transporter subunit IICBA [Anaerostipes]|uniref:PTS mannitol transporter subunit IICBA n=1 Tax=Anaerostipes TaxID=207244 RepID=UPI00033BB249|nr:MULTISPECIES: PTS mannitol transporter subunit IICBA [Anaerostipes]MCB6296661.1 PTS mannitol transporter subunit IICBA [Anaerostipes caccae]MCB6334987.1 PTS mannitol transporter subunit IICBA [Anaerostipes caccae]MCB6338091.1 PTS mannitol transporter subunit IICBA [Anaerostipes caccae]MCB6352985.1 PTS mannitol transporter subunit IICBA [Anaerostipes caccae]MCB6358390.1 PTS mannitol transporter subunit IICBA [Anaerostipes caccae]